MLAKISRLTYALLFWTPIAAVVVWLGSIIFDWIPFNWPLVFGLGFVTSIIVEIVTAEH